MNPAGVSINQIVLFGIGLTSIVCCVILFKIGMWPKRRGNTPHCPKCDYNLTGAVSNHCPECGTEISAETTVRGDSYRRPGFIAAGVASFVLAGTCFIIAGKQVNLYRFQPAAWVMTDMQSTNNTISQQAWKELVRRDSINKLSAKHCTKLIKICMQEQSRKTLRWVSFPMFEYLGQCYLDGKLSRKQKKDFFENMVDQEFKTRPRIIAGDELVYCFTSLQSHGPLRGSGFWMYAHDASLLLDGKPIGVKMPPGLIETGQIFVQPGGDHFYISSHGKPKPGRHTLGAVYDVEFYHGPIKKKKKSQFCHKVTISKEASFEVLESEPPDYIKKVNDPSIKEELLNDIEPRPITLKKGHLLLQVTEYPPPINVAFNVYALIKGKEYYAGYTVSRKRDSGTSDAHFGGVYTGPTVESCDLIFRSSKEAAKKTIDIFEIWDGELIYKNVPIKVRK